MVDVALLLEGTYPYVAGGVSNWVDALIRAMGERTFGLICLLPSRRASRAFKFSIPSNVTDVVEVYLDETVVHEGEPVEAPAAWAALRDAHHAMLDGQWAASASTLEAVVAGHHGGPGVCPAAFGGARQSWDLLVDLYERAALDSSFLDYFWTWRYSHAPIFTLLQAEIIPARLYHAVSTGWAGLLAAIARKRTGRRFVLTEHGIYTHERRMEIVQAEWIHDEEQPSSVAAPAGGLREVWARLFEGLGRIAYEAADEIYALDAGNRAHQLALGAPADKVRIIRNGVRLESYPARSLRAAEARFVAGFVGRVVPIKDVKTFITACRYLVEDVRDLVAYVIGPTDEDSDYFEECRQLARLLGMQERIVFTGAVDVRTYYPRLDALVLTSVSESQPLAILEAWCAEVPVVVTDVGACREMVLGSDAEDRALGPAGLVTPVGDPEATAHAMRTLARDPAAARRLGETGRRRVERYYDLRTMIAGYRDVYRRHLEGAS